jgi:hypothetical protein
MDQLKVMLVHRFWILSALAILIPPISWWMSTGDMAKQTDVRAKQIESSIKKIQTLSKDLSKAANADWIDGAKQVNVKLASLVDQTQKRLYDHQRPVMSWHPVVRKALDDAKVKYRGDNAGNPQAFLVAKKLYIARYADQWQHALQIVEPFSWTTGDGKVWCAGLDANNQAEITKAPVDAWQSRQIISSEELWDAQEDLWMLQALFKAIARVNEGSISIDDARIKKLTVAILRGGNLADRDDRRKPKTGTGGIPGKAAPVGVQGGGGPPRAMPMIDSDDIFGSDDSSSGSRSGANTRGGFGGGGGGGGSEGRRYVTVSSGKWRTRGFVLRVIMDHQEIPKLLTMLSDSPFPVQIWQVEHEPNNPKGNRITSAGAPEYEADPKRAKERQQRVMMALSQPYLADVLIAGTFTFFEEPAAANAQPSPSAPAAVPTPPGTKPPTVATPAVPPSKGAPTNLTSPAAAAGSAPAKAGSAKRPIGGGPSQLPQDPKANVTPTPSVAPLSAPKVKQPAKP